MVTKKQILLQCQSIIYMYTGLAAILTKYSQDEVDIDIVFTKRVFSEEFFEYIKMNKYFNNLYIPDFVIVDKIIKRLNKLKVNYFNKIYFDKVYKKYITFKFREQFNNNKYSEIFYSEGSDFIMYLNIAYPNAHFVMYGDGSGLIYNPCNSKLIDFYNPTCDKKLYEIKSPDEIISLAPYKKENSVSVSGISVSATNPQILLEIIQQDISIQQKVDNFAKNICSECSYYDKKILLLPSRLEDKRFLMSDDDQINIYIDMINNYATENSLIIIKPHPTSKINLIPILQKRCNCKIIEIPNELKPLPVEVYTNLLKQMDIIITFLSSSKISLKAIYNIDSFDAYDIIQNYPLKERVNVDLDVYQKVYERFDSWDKHSIIYECDVLPEYTKFYKKYHKPTYVSRKNTFVENVFSVRNIIGRDNKHKQVTILGIKLKFKNKVLN